MGGRREGETTIPPVPEPFVQGPFEQKREEGRDIFACRSYFRITQGYFPITPAYPKVEPSEEFL